MADKVINKDSIARDLQKRQQLSDLSDEEIKSAIQQQRQNQLGQTLGSAAGTAGDIFLQGQPFHTIDPTTGRPITLPAGGIRGAKQPSQLDELIQLQKFNLLEKQAEQKQRQAEQKEERESFKFGEEKKTAARKEAEDKRKRALTGEPEPTDEPTAEPIPTALPTPTPTPQPAAAAQVAPQAIPTTAGGREEVVTGFTEEGVPTTTVQERPEVKIRRVQATKLASGQRISFTNLEKVAGSISDLDKVFAEGHREGVIGAGRLSKIGLGLAKERGGTLLDKFQASNKFEGKKAEVLFNMIPMLTQQGEKPGSVRIMRSVLKLLGQTLPDIGTSLTAGRNQMSESIRSFFRFARAAELGGIEFDRQFTGVDFRDLATEEIDKNGIVTITSVSPELRGWVAKVRRAAGRVQLGLGEEEALNLFVDNSLFSTKNLLSEREIEGQGKIAVRELDATNTRLIEIERELGGQ